MGLLKKSRRTPPKSFGLRCVQGLKLSLLCVSVFRIRYVSPDESDTALIV